MGWRRATTYAELACPDPVSAVPFYGPAGYEQLLGQQGHELPLIVVSMPTGYYGGGAVLGGFILGQSVLGDAGVRPSGKPLRDAGIPAKLISDRQQYIPAYTGDRIERNLTIGRGAIGHLRPYHGRLDRPVALGIGEAAIGDDPIDPYLGVYTETLP